MSQWLQIHDTGGRDGQLAKDFGIVSVPTMFIVGKSGKMAGAVTADNLEEAVKMLLPGKSWNRSLAGEQPWHLSQSNKADDETQDFRTADTSHRPEMTDLCTFKLQ